MLPAPSQYSNVLFFAVGHQEPDLDPLPAKNPYPLASAQKRGTSRQVFKQMRNALGWRVRDVFVLPSYREGFRMLWWRPARSSSYKFNINGCTEIIQHGQGLAWLFQLKMFMPCVMRWSRWLDKSSASQMGKIGRALWRLISDQQVVWNESVEWVSKRNLVDNQMISHQ